MSCYFRHMKDILEEAGITVDPANKKTIDQALHQIMGIGYKDCPATWKALKQTVMADQHKRHELIQKLQSAIR
jgi:hypothetical protein